MRTRWTQTLVVDHAGKIARELGHFPAVSELHRMGRNDLACAIGRHGGFIAVSKLVGVPRIASDSDTGWEGETMFAYLCSVQGLTAARTGHVKAPYDMDLNGCVRVDVKSARKANYGRSTGWFYRIGKHPQADVVVLLQLDTSEFYALPWWVCPTTNVTIASDGGKYAPYRCNWSLIRDLVVRRSDEMRSLSA